MKNFIKIFKSFVCILFTLLLSGTQHAKAQDCLAKLKQFNTAQSGVPSAKITEYEGCVTTLAQQGNKDVDLLIKCYNKLIKFYDDQNNNTKVNYYKSKLQQLSSHAPKPSTKIPAKQHKDTTPLTNRKKDTPPQNKKTKI